MKNYLLIRNLYRLTPFIFRAIEKKLDEEFFKFRLDKLYLA